MTLHGIHCAQSDIRNCFPLYTTAIGYTETGMFTKIVIFCYLSGTSVD